MDNKKITVAIVYTDKNKLSKADTALNHQTFISNCEKIFINNIDNKFKSMASAYNRVLEVASGEVMVFMHQDIYLLDFDILERWYNFICKNPDSIIGAAGIQKKRFKSAF